MGLCLNTERQCEADVAFDHVAHIGQAIAELQCTFQAHAKGEAGVFLRLPTTRLVGVTAGRGDYVPVWGEIMEWGTPLHQVLRDGCLSEQQAVEMLLPVLVTVDRLAEKQHIVHRDIDEGNVFLVDGQLKLGDFGAATTFAEDAPYTKTRLLGKTGQCPPEYLYSPDDQEGPEGVTGQMTDAWLLNILRIKIP